MTRFANVFLFIITLVISSSSIHAQNSFWDTFEHTATTHTITVYRSQTCQCCKRWISHLEKHGFTVDDRVVNNTHAVKDAVNLPRKVSSCHTAIIGDYIIEGHVPAPDIKALLIEKPDIAGLSVPQMPHGTPGMETGLRSDDFHVFSFTKNGKVGMFNSYKHIGNNQYQPEKKRGDN